MSQILVDPNTDDHLNNSWNISRNNEENPHSLNETELASEIHWLNNDQKLLKTQTYNYKQTSVISCLS